MPGYIDKSKKFAVVAPTSPADLAMFLRSAVQGLEPTPGVRPKTKGLPLSAEQIEEICQGMKVNQQILGEGG